MWIYTMGCLISENKKPHSYYGVCSISAMGFRLTVSYNIILFLDEVSSQIDSQLAHHLHQLPDIFFSYYSMNLL